LYKISRRLIKHTTVPIYNLVVFILFTFRKYLLGFSNALKFLERVSKSSIIPILKMNGAIVGKNCDIETGITFHNCIDFNNLHLGDNCHIGKNCFIDLRDRIIIENNVVISMGTTLITHQDLSKSGLRTLYPESSSEIHIMDNCYIGANSTIIKGVSIQDRSIVAAGSVVTSNVPSHVVVGGIPAKHIKDVTSK
jgi:acetyltransferase-like isoleucine patch superfamily enzyme